MRVLMCRVHTESAHLQSAEDKEGVWGDSMFLGKVVARGDIS